MSSLRPILNGKSAGQPRVREAVKAVRADGHRVEVRVTWEAGDVERMTAEALADAASGHLDTIVAGGGDGTINGVFGAVASSPSPKLCTLGILPLGTASDFAHAAGLPVADLTACLRIAADGPARDMDIGVLDGRPFINLLSGGFGSRVTVETDPELKRRLGGLAYVLTGLARLKDLTASRGRFRAENFEWEGPFLAIAIGNGRQAGGGIALCPDALVNDGKLDLMILPDLAVAQRDDVLGQLLRDGAMGIGALQHTARSAWIEYESDEELHINLDGEPMRSRKFRVECRPGALSVRLGNSPLLRAAA